MEGGTGRLQMAKIKLTERKVAVEAERNNTKL
jgi:hypothetical protein